MSDDKTEARLAVRNAYSGFATIARLHADRSFTVDLEEVADGHYRYKADYHLDHEADDHFEGDVYYQDGRWEVEQDHDV